jgi:cell division septation protein DedD
MNIQIKQRVVGLVILIVVILGISAIIFLGSRKNNIYATNNSPVDIQIPDNKPADSDAPKLIAQADSTTNSVPDTISPQNSTLPEIPQDNSLTVNNSSAASVSVPTAPEPLSVPAQNSKNIPATNTPAINSSTSDNVLPASSGIKDQQNSTLNPPASTTLPTKPAPDNAIPDNTANHKIKALPKFAADKPKEPKIHKTIHKTIVNKTDKNISKYHWAVKAGNFADQVKAQDLIKQLSKNGYRIFVQKKASEKNPDVVEMLVFVGPVSSKDQAKKIVTKIDHAYHLHALVAKHN